MSRFIISYDELPISVNNYLRPSATYDEKTGEVKMHLYETKQAKDFKKRFKAYLKREVKKQKWDLEQTRDGHFYLDCVFIQARTNSDNNNYYKILCDSLTGIVTIDDKNVLVRTQKVMYNAKNPSFKAVLHKVGYTGIFNSDEAQESFINSNCLSCKKKTESCTILRKAKEGRIQDDIFQDNGFITCKKRKV